MSSRPRGIYALCRDNFLKRLSVAPFVVEFRRFRMQPAATKDRDVNWGGNEQP
jgi:hypothetical protein